MIKPIKTEGQYEEMLLSVYSLMQENLEPGSPKGDELEVLSILVSQYENDHFPIPKPNPFEAIKFRVEQMKL